MFSFISRTGRSQSNYVAAELNLAEYSHACIQSYYVLLND